MISRCLCVCCGLLATWLLAVAGEAVLPGAPDLALKAELVWGTDEPKPADRNLKDLDQKLHEKLSRVFKWKNYFLVQAKKIELMGRQTKRVVMSPKCDLELRVLDDLTLEVKLFGEKKLTATKKQAVKALKQGEILVLGGDDKDKYGDAWFVVISFCRN